LTFEAEDLAAHNHADMDAFAVEYIAVHGRSSYRDAPAKRLRLLAGDSETNRTRAIWRTPYGSNAVLKPTRDCTMLGSSMRRVGLIDITVGNATRLGASQRSATRRCASHHIATQRLSRWGSPAARSRLARTVPLKRLWLRDGHVIVVRRPA
jgi:hypothetical protein